MITANRQIISGNGTVPATTGLVTFASNINLLDMPLSGFSVCDIQYTQKICGMRFLSSSILRVAIAEFGIFKSSNILVFDVDINAGTIHILSTYQILLFDDCDDSFVREFLSIDVMSSGDVIIAGRDRGIPFLMKWNTTLQSPVFYLENDCDDNQRAKFHFTLPTFHPEFLEIPSSFSILQDNGSEIIAVVTGIRSLNDVSLDVDGFPSFGFAKFNSNDLSFISINGSGTAATKPDLFEPGQIRAGLVGSGGGLVVQFSGMRKRICAYRTFPFVLDSIIRLVDPLNFNTLSEVNYSDAIGYRNQGDIFQSTGAYPIDAFQDFILRSESTGIYEIDSTTRKFSESHALMCLVEGYFIYSMELTRQGRLGLTLYTV